MCGGSRILARAMCTAASLTFPVDFQDGLIPPLIPVPYLTVFASATQTCKSHRVPPSKAKPPDLAFFCR